MSADERVIAETLATHSHHSTSAGWTGSPDPSNWRNIRPVCRCKTRLIETRHWTNAKVADAHRTHVAAEVAAALDRHRPAAGLSEASDVVFFHLPESLGAVGYRRLLADMIADDLAARGGDQDAARALDEGRDA